MDMIWNSKKNNMKRNKNFLNNQALMIKKFTKQEQKKEEHKWRKNKNFKEK